MADYSLPELPYDYEALEPYISGEIMELHHDKHHATYVKGINTAVDQLSEMRDKEEFTFLGTLEKNLAFHLGGPGGERAEVGLAADDLRLGPHQRQTPTHQRHRWFAPPGVPGL